MVADQIPRGVLRAPELRADRVVGVADGRGGAEVRHPKVDDDGLGQLRRLREVVARARRDVAPEDVRLRGAAREEQHEAVAELRARHGFRLVRAEERDAEAAAGPRPHGRADRVVDALEHEGREHVARLVHGDAPVGRLARAVQIVLEGLAEEHVLDGAQVVGPRRDVAAVGHGPQRRLVDDRVHVGADEARRQAREVRGERGVVAVRRGAGVGDREGEASRVGAVAERRAAAAERRGRRGRRRERVVMKRRPEAVARGALGRDGLARQGAVRRLDDAHEGRRAAGVDGELARGRRFQLLLHVVVEELAPPLEVRRAQLDDLVEAALAEQGRVQARRAVRRREDDDERRAVVARAEPVQLHEQLVQRVVVVRADGGAVAAARAAAGVDLVDEDERRAPLRGRGRAPRGREELAHALDADARVLALDHLRAGDDQERRVQRLRRGPREQRLARARRPDEQDVPRRRRAAAPRARRGLAGPDDVDEPPQLAHGALGADDVVPAHAALGARRAVVDERVLLVAAARRAVEEPRDAGAAAAEHGVEDAAAGLGHEDAGVEEGQQRRGALRARRQGQGAGRRVRGRGPGRRAVLRELLELDRGGPLRRRRLGDDGEDRAGEGHAKKLRCQHASASSRGFFAAPWRQHLAIAMACGN